MPERYEKRNPVIHDVFPIGRKSAIGAVHAIISPDDRETVTTLYQIFETIKIGNREVVRSLFSLLTFFDASLGQDPDRDADFWLGALYGYEVLSREAQTRGGYLPTISPDVIRTNISDQTSIGDIPLSHINIKESEIFAAGEAVGTNITGKIDGLLSAEPEFTQGFELLMREMKVGQKSAWIAKVGAYQMCAIFKTHSEIQKVRQMMR